MNLSNTRQTRANFIRLLSGMSLEAINHIPEGFNNNLIWNFGHIIATQQLLTYSLSGLEPKVDEEILAAFRKGTKPEKVHTTAELEGLKRLAVTTLDQLETDLSEGLFKTFESYPTSFGVELTSIEEAVAFNAIHEGLHLGYAMALKRAL
ncbi:MAG: DinB family protein [Mameliella sp.]|nr:DinB family protein [Phaeodactylibacter sp.]NRA51872.1 DinB family protein [Phaeodactylibacter sp.]